MELKTFFAQDLVGTVIPSPTVTVYQPDTTTLVTGLQNASGAALTNPFSGGGNGQVTLAAPDGDYDIKVEGAGRTTIMRVRFLDAGSGAADVLREDLEAPPGATLIGADDGEGGSKFTNAQEAIDYLRAQIGEVDAFEWAALPAAINRIDWALHTVSDGVNVLRYIPPAQWAAIFARTSTYDCTADLQAWIDGFATHKRRLYMPTGRYRITAPLTLRIATASNSDTLTIDGDGDLNTQIWLDNNAAAGVFAYDNGWTAVTVAGCATTSGSGVVTTTGSFSGVAVGAFVTMQGLGGNVTSVDSATQITVNRNADATASGKTARIYNTAAAAKNRLRLRNLFLTHSQSVVPKTSWHSGTAIKLNGVVNSEFENLRVQGFTRGIDTLGGWMNTFKNVLTSGCREGFYCDLVTYRWVFDRCATVNSGGASTDWAGLKLINGGGVELIAHITEQDNVGLELQGIRGWSIEGGNIENVSYSYAIILKGLPWAYTDERWWTLGGKIGGVRIYNSLGVIATNGVRGVRIYGNAFEISQPGFTPTGQSWIRTTGEANLVRDIDEGGNTFPTGLDSITHIVAPAAAPTLAMAQSITRNGKRYSSSVPYYGKYWSVGDEVERLPSSYTAGAAMGWVCTAASSGADGTATWKAKPSIAA